MKRLTVLYDGTCGFCVECARWLQAQRQTVRLDLVSSSSLVARARYVVADDEAGPPNAKRYYSALKEHPDAVLAHSEVKKVLKDA